MRPLCPRSLVLRLGHHRSSAHLQPCPPSADQPESPAWSSSRRTRSSDSLVVTWTTWHHSRFQKMSWYRMLPDLEPAFAGPLRLFPVAKPCATPARREDLACRVDGAPSDPHGVLLALACEQQGYFAPLRRGMGLRPLVPRGAGAPRSARRRANPTRRRCGHLHQELLSALTLHLAKIRRDYPATPPVSGFGGTMCLLHGNQQELAGGAKGL